MYQQVKWTLKIQTLQRTFSIYVSSLLNKMLNPDYEVSEYSVQIFLKEWSDFCLYGFFEITDFARIDEKH